jgi:hypothetical protein
VVPDRKATHQYSRIVSQDHTGSVGKEIELSDAKVVINGYGLVKFHRGRALMEPFLNYIAKQQGMPNLYKP